jgi:16S rRNA (guanine(1405)-N(7))-methyltransferase
VAQILESAKYRHVCPDLIRRLGARELSIRRNLKEAIKETKNTLHQVAGAFADSGLRYDACLQSLQAARLDESPQGLRRACAEIMERHASTRERLPLLDEFYATLLGDLAPARPIRSILDVACGLNPLTLPWMPLAPGAAYYACDLYGDMMTFLNSFFALSGLVEGHAETHDVVTSLPECRVDVALVLKALPPLEQTAKAAGLHLLRRLPAEIVIVSFPTRTLGGRNKQMEVHYETRFRDLIRDEPWRVERFLFANELCFRITK